MTARMPMHATIRPGRLDLLRRPFWWIMRGILHTVGSVAALSIPSHHPESCGKKTKAPPMRGRKPCNTACNRRKIP